MFEIYMGDDIVGNADVKRNGLYYHINCTCQPPSKAIHRVVMYNGSTENDLGICVPTGNVFTLFARIPVKKVQGERFTFELMKEAKGEFIISDNEPFAHLDKLETAHLRHTNGQSKLVIDSIQDPRGSGQNQEYQNK